MKKAKESKQKKRGSWGFLAIIGLVLLALLVAVVPRFKLMLDKAQEASRAGALGEIKSAASMYYGDHEGNWPSSLEQLVPKYMKEIPSDPNGNTKMVLVYDGTGGWVYDSTLGNASPNFEVPSRSE